MLWDVKRLENRRYTIRSSQTHEYASEPRRDGGAVVAQAKENDWEIKETRVKGEFVYEHSNQSDSHVRVTWSQFQHCPRDEGVLLGFGQ